MILGRLGRTNPVSCKTVLSHAFCGGFFWSVSLSALLGSEAYL
jgi:hypothetical protein